MSNHLTRRKMFDKSNKWFTAFIIASILDVVLTSTLLMQEVVVEANPIANFYLSNWDISGLVYFKTCMVFFIILICCLIRLLEIRFGKKKSYTKWLLLYACIITFSVCIYQIGIFCFY